MRWLQRMSNHYRWPEGKTGFPASFSGWLLVSPCYTPTNFIYFVFRSDAFRTFGHARCAVFPLGHEWFKQCDFEFFVTVFWHVMCGPIDGSKKTSLRAKVEAKRSGRRSFDRLKEGSFHYFRFFLSFWSAMSLNTVLYHTKSLGAALLSPPICNQTSAVGKRKRISPPQLETEWRVSERGIKWEL